MDENGDRFSPTLADSFRSGLPSAILHAFAPLYDSIPHIQRLVEAAQDCAFWFSDPTYCREKDAAVVNVFMQATEESFRVCPQESKELARCYESKGNKSLELCTHARHSWMKCLYDKANINVWR